MTFSQPLRVGLMGVALWSGAAQAAAASTNLPPALHELPGAGFSILRLCGSLALVLALFLGGVWLFKNWQRLAVQRGRSPKLNILEVRPLGNRQALYLVAYEQQRLLVGASPSGLHLITHLPKGEMLQTASPPVAASFAQSLQRAIAPKA